MIGRLEARRSAPSFVASLRLSFALIGAFPSISTAQKGTPNPGAWRPLVYADLKTEKPENLTYIDIWKDAIAANNRASDATGRARPASENAPAADAHVVIRSAQRVIVLSTLDTEAACKPTEFAKSTSLTVKLCPTRLVIFEGPVGKTKDLPASCFLEANSTATDPNAAGSYVAYDTIAKMIKLGLVLDHKPVDECARFIPVTQ